MKIKRTKPEITNSKLEFKQNRMLSFIVKFWQFSEFYGNYLGSMHSNSIKQPKPKDKKQNE